MIGWIGVAAVLAAGQAVPTAQRPEVAIVVVTLDEARQGQIKHGRNVLAALGDERFGRYRLLEPAIPTAGFEDCVEDHPEYGLNFCARFNLHRAWNEGAPPHVVVAFTDHDLTWREDDGDMRALCYGRGDRAADAAAQNIWLWTGSARMHGVRDWDRDQDALAACIDAAMAEVPGTPRPDPLRR